MRCATCEAEALVCGTCINLGNEALKMDLHRKNQRIKEALATVAEVRESRIGGMAQVYLDAIECALLGKKEP